MYLKFLARFRDLGLFILRLGVGFFYVVAHGGPKIFAGPERWKGLGGAMGNIGITFFPVFWGFMAAFAEFAGGILLILGLLFRPATVLLIITMFMAMLSHIAGGDSLGQISHSGKMLFVFLGLLFIGPGRYSIDQKLGKA